LETLSVGDHKVNAVFEDGSASATFSVKTSSQKDEKDGGDSGDTKDKGKKTDEPDGNVLPTGSTTYAQTSRASLPNTGDASYVAPLSAAGAMALTASAVARRRRKTK
jgi:LPXTG-motif cell wall-anchored protein